MINILSSPTICNWSFTFIMCPVKISKITLLHKFLLHVVISVFCFEYSFSPYFTDSLLNNKD